MTRDQTEGAGAIWVASEPLPGDATFAVTVHYGQDRSRVLDRDTALRYAAAVHAAALRAEHDAAVLAQLAKLGTPMLSIAGTVQHLREKRPSLDDVTAPLRLVSCVSGTRLVGYLEVHVGKKQVGQWEPADAREHASHVLGALAAVDLDTAYREYLVGTVGLDAATAQGTIGDLATFLGGARP